MNLPPALRRALADRLVAVAGPAGLSLDSFRAIGGGCIHHAGRLDTPAGPLFLKWNSGEAATGFTSEARSLEALRAAVDPDLLDVPEVLDARDADHSDGRRNDGRSGDGQLGEGSTRHEADRARRQDDVSGRHDGDASTLGWLVLEFLPPSPPSRDHDERLGRGLAELHSVPQPALGWPETNRIGPLHQVNPTRERWADFWVEARLLPQLRAARDAGLLARGDAELLERVVEATPEALEPLENDAPALVHGDLWSGNVHPGPGGRPVLVDPAAYRGHGEVDLAMARLFGGFGRGTFQAYEAVRPMPEGFSSVRCPLYQLYYLLVHVRLFGASYLGQTRSAARSVLSALGKG